MVASAGVLERLGAAREPPVGVVLPDGAEMTEHWGDDMRRRLRAIAKADRESRIVDWIVRALAFPALLVRRIWRG